MKIIRCDFRESPKTYTGITTKTGTDEEIEKLVDGRAEVVHVYKSEITGVYTICIPEE